MTLIYGEEVEDVQEDVAEVVEEVEDEAEGRVVMDILLHLLQGGPGRPRKVVAVEEMGQDMEEVSAPVK